MLSANEPNRSLVLAWRDKFDESFHANMLKCKGPARSWYLQMATDCHFHASDNKFNFRDPKWPIVYTTPSKELTSETDDVFNLLGSAGALIQEVFGMNYTDIIQLDPYTYSRFKKKVLEVYEKRAKEMQEQQEEMERERREEELQRQQEERKNKRTYNDSEY